MILQSRQDVLAGPSARRHRSTRRERATTASALFVAALTVLLLAAACGAGDDGRPSGNVDAATVGDGDGAKPASQRAAGTAPGGRSQVIAGLGLPLAQLVDQAGVPGLGETSTQGVSVSPEQRTCLEQKASSLAPEDLRVVTAGGDLSELSPSGGSVVGEAISACITPTFLGERLAEEYVIRLRADAATDPGFGPCIADELADGTGPLVTEVARQRADGVAELTSPLAEMIDPCGGPHLEGLLTDHFASDGLGVEAASCISLGFSERVRLSEVAERGTVSTLRDELSPTLQLDLEDLREECGAP